MSRRLPFIDRADFETLIEASSPASLTPASKALLYGHYQALQKWSARLALIGPGTVEEVIDRHYGESLAALPWLDEDSLPGRRAVDVGSGAGFPGIVLALARPGLAIWLVESRGKKCTFLEASLRAARAQCQALADRGDVTAQQALAALSVQVVNARIGSPLPAELPSQFDLVTTRAVRLSSAILEPLREQQPNARYLLWLGARSDLPEWLVATRRHRLEGSHGRYLVDATARFHAFDDQTRDDNTPNYDTCDDHADT